MKFVPLLVTLMNCFSPFFGFFLLLTLPNSFLYMPPHRLSCHKRGWHLVRWHGAAAMRCFLAVVHMCVCAHVPLVMVVWVGLVSLCPCSVFHLFFMESVCCCHSHSCDSNRPLAIPTFLFLPMSLSLIENIVHLAL